MRSGRVSHKSFIITRREGKVLQDAYKKFPETKHKTVNKHAGKHTYADMPNYYIYKVREKTLKYIVNIKQIVSNGDEDDNVENGDMATVITILLLMITMEWWFW